MAAVADREPEKVRMLLYLDAFRPEKVRTPQGALDPSEFGPPPTGSWSIPFTEKILDNIGKDVKGADRKWMLSKATPWPLKPAHEPVILSKNFDSVKSAYTFCTGGGDPVDEILKGKWGKARGSTQGHRIRALADDNDAKRAGQRHARPSREVTVGLDKVSNTTRA